MFLSLHRFKKNNEGVAAVEFAILAPFMIILFLGMVEVSDLMMAHRRVTIVTSTVADLVAQAEQITDDDVADVFDASRLIMSPYDSTAIQIRVTSVDINLDGTVEVGWSDGYNMTPYAVDDPFILPTGIGAPGGSIIVSEVSFDYNSIVKFINVATITMTDSFFALPRRTLAIQRIP